MLSQFTKLNAIEVLAPLTTPRQAIEEAGKLLVAGGFATPAYTQAMLTSFQTNGAYFVIAPGIAMPHARPESGVLVNGISLLTLQTPLDFGNAANGPADLIIGLAATGADRHIQLIQAVAQAFSARWRYRQLMSCTTSKQVLSLLETDAPDER
ncbi:MAG: PTS sugar transporter subunit IIA [Lactobacillus sp.]|jgi:PTS system ascorbate-specific IIA component|uniref:Ascorbate-specific PTS system EIIA component n=1 Tax=Lacticaseibacillus suilingensis TaxID=2799577 RepID=A0ABW4BIP2_9LACO|nr:PTS sugar transporter subunit IIA [Lacticaseibacillus suilingensis]MCI1894683.1 PTS sugar transporter subunit IIA [Lactobacillus sp.]MCI1918270.1 PTS sugar transporter subunit IIA [Lactobacillus sp.]MCI1940450.1 PTS sugar transporter subunit IIA [Lactobacillus sp.]MCI1971145.1 PTS sugar transporter subunit IIA [Lactobacillus sp.]MCI2017879.1 PTS sugar transporter subunit IIA [Lactobacillus sp.]